MGDFIEISNSKVKPEEFTSTNGVIIKQEPDDLETADKNLQEWKTSNKFLETIKIEDVAGLHRTSIKVDCDNRYIDEQDDLEDQVSFANKPPDGHTTLTNFIHEENTKSQAIEITQTDDLKDSEKIKCIQCRFCEYKTKNKYILMRHFMAKHDETAEWLKCQFCDYRNKVESNLKKHLYYSHNDNVKWHTCQSCEFKTKRKARLTDHINYKHNTNAEWLQCGFCDYKTKLKTTFRQHVRYKHGGGNLTWHHCKLCDYKTKYKSNLFKHHNNKHAENAEHYHCEVCDYKTKIRGHLSRHHKCKHEGRLEWHKFHCKVCDFKTKLKSILNHHLLSEHDIISEWFRCQICRYKTKVKTKLSRHMNSNHAKGVEDVNSKQNEELVNSEVCKLEILEGEVMTSIKVDSNKQMAIKCDDVDDKTDYDNDYMEENRMEFAICETNIKKEDESFTHMKNNAVGE